MEHIDLRVTIYDPKLALRFRSYVQRVWGNQKGAQAAILKRALKEFLDREQRVEELMEKQV